MTKEYKGGLTGILVMVPVLMLVITKLNNDFTEEHGFTMMMITFLAVNLILATIFSSQRTVSGIFLLFLAYCLVILTVITIFGGILFFIALRLGLISFNKIGG
jgi:hypothetical protein